MSDVVVSTEWVAARIGGRPPAAGGRTHVIDVSSSADGYAAGHLPGAVAIAWRRELIPNEDESSGMVIDPHRFAALARKLGLRPNDALIFYGDEGGRHAARALWTFAYYRHAGALHWMDGGRERWRAEGRPLTGELPDSEPGDYPAPSARDDTLRTTRDEIRARLDDPSYAVLDVRTAAEYSGVDVRAARGGHIPGARHVFWEDAIAADGTLRPKEELAALYAPVPRDATVAVHCQLGVRSAHTWLVLKHVLDYPDVRNYDGSWQDWGNREDTPVEA